MKSALLLITTFLCCFANVSLGKHPKSFEEAKEQASIIWASHPQTLYCGCTFNKQLEIDHQSCNYIFDESKRANKVEWEHIVPASWFGKQRKCWRKPICKTKKGKRYKGRKCCEKSDRQFRKMYTDLHNLAPAIGEVNQARSDYAFGEFYKNRKNKYKFHGCNIIISKRYHIVEPRDEVKGLVARAYLYMENTYHFKLSKNQKNMFNDWNKKYPPTDWEIQWNNKVRKIQNMDNAYISGYEIQ